MGTCAWSLSGKYHGKQVNFGLTLMLCSDCPVLCLGGGTPHKPAMLSETGHVIHEASAYAAYLKQKAGNISESTIPGTEELMSLVYC